MKEGCEVWKLQAPLFSTSDDVHAEVLAYTKNKKKLAVIPMLPSQLDMVFKGEDKIYVLARVKRGVLQIKYKVVDEEDW